jgi:hypothetical protein
MLWATRTISSLPAQETYLLRRACQPSGTMNIQNTSGFDLRLTAHVRRVAIPRADIKKVQCRNLHWPATVQIKPVPLVPDDMQGVARFNCTLVTDWQLGNPTATSKRHVKGLVTGDTGIAGSPQGYAWNRSPCLRTWRCASIGSLFRGGVAQDATAR